MNNYRFMYIRDEFRNPRGVIVITVVGEFAYFEYSVCAPSDSFDKDIGKKIAISRFENDPFVVQLTDPNNRNVVLRDVLAHIKRNSTSDRAIKFTHNWLTMHAYKK